METLQVHSKQVHQVRYIENKRINKRAIDRYLDISANANHWTNFGPLSRLLEDRLHQILGLDNNLRVVVSCNATIALHALVMLQRSKKVKSQRWLTSSFGFYSSADGVLAKADIVDCDKDAMLDLSLCPPDSYDGFIATNIFGQMANMDSYHKYAQQHKKMLIIDSAMGFQHGGHIANECISLHHTKPWGFGECGCAIVHKDDENTFRNIIAFGHPDKKTAINRFSTNGKVSDISCAYVLMWLDQYDDLKADYNTQYERIANIALACGFTILGNKNKHPSTPSNVPTLLPEAKLTLADTTLPKSRYYHPLSPDTKVANSIFQRIVNIPCHRDMANFSNDEIRDDLNRILTS